MLVSEKIDVQNLIEKYRTPQGIYVLEGVSASAGVLPYTVDENGKTVNVGIFTSPYELFKSISYLIGVPVVKEHPEKFNAETTNMQGICLNAYEMGEWNIGVVVGIWGETLLDYVKLGNYELSAGYTANIIKTDGNWYGSPYSYEKTDIRYNHLAVVEKGTARNGANNRIIFDSSTIKELKESFTFSDAKNSHTISNFSNLQTEITDSQKTNSSTTEKMKQLTYIDSDGFKQVAEVDPELYQYVVSLQKTKENLTTQMEDSKSAIVNVNNITADLETAKQQLQDSKSSVIELEQKIEESKKLLPSYLKIATKAEKLGVKLNFDNFDINNVMREALKDKYPDIKNVSEETLNYLFTITEPETKKEVTDSKKTTIKTLLNGTQIQITDSKEDTLPITRDDLAEHSASRRRGVKSSK